MVDRRYVIGVDFGTLSGRAILVDARTGHIEAQRERVYSHGVITRLPQDEPLARGWALQDPDDYLEVLEDTIPGLLRETGIPGEAVAGLGCDATSCTILPALEDGTPLCRLAPYRETPHAYGKLWKHHGAYRQAVRIKDWAEEQEPELLRRYGGKVSAQWMLPKVLQLLEEAPELYERSDLILEATDWLTYQLTDTVSRNTCCAGFKSFWDPESGYPSEKFLTGLDPRLADLVPKKLRGRMTAPWGRAGFLTCEWAERLGLTTNVAVAGGMIDAHASVLGSGITGPDKLLMILGTSACHMLLSPREVKIPGICGSCRDGILPGYYGYEAGQACVGDMLDWFVRGHALTADGGLSREEAAQIHTLLSRQAACLEPGESGLVALDWWNGQRTPLVDDLLTGAMVGMTLRTTPAEQYRALLESAAFGTRRILEFFEVAGISAKEIVACGGIAGKNPLMMQIFADVLDRPIRVAASDQCSALGAAVLAATAAGLWPDLIRCVEKMTRPGEKVYTPNLIRVRAYEPLYQMYLEMSDRFAGNGIMHRLSSLREARELQRAGIHGECGRTEGQ